MIIRQEHQSTRKENTPLCRDGPSKLKIGYPEDLERL